MKVPKSGLPVERRKALHLRRFATATSRRSYRPLAPLFLVLLPRQIPRASHLSTAMPRQPAGAFMTRTPATPTAQAAPQFRGTLPRPAGLIPRQNRFLGSPLIPTNPPPQPPTTILTTSSP